MARSRHHTGWAGALAVAAELSRREYDAAITLGNTPVIDLICQSPETDSGFSVQVKSVTGRDWIFIRKEHLQGPPVANRFFAIVRVPAEDSAPFEFHFLRHQDVCDIYAGQRREKLNGEPYQRGTEGVAWSSVTPYRDRWDLLPR